MWYKYWILDTWQPIDSTGSQPDPGIEVTYQKMVIGHVYQLKVFRDENFKYDIKIKFWTPARRWIVLEANLIQV